MPYSCHFLKPESAVYFHKVQPHWNKKRKTILKPEKSGGTDWIYAKNAVSCG